MGRNNNISKKQYISAAHHIIRNDGLSALTIRRLGRDLNCNTANLYRYFESLEELSMYAALTFLRDYLFEVSELLTREEDCVERYYGVWDCFCKHAFANAALFDMLFFGKYQNRLYLVITDYYDIFPEELDGLGNMRTVFLQGDFDYRDYLFLDDIVGHGRMDESHAMMLNRVIINMFKGFFKKVLDLELSQTEQIVERNKFREVMRFVFIPYLTSTNN